jgi:hypothetical protein
MHTPMDLNSTPFIKYHEIDTKNKDLIEDAWGLNSDFCDVVRLLEEYRPLPDKHLISSLIEHFRQTKC